MRLFKQLKVFLQVFEIVCDHLNFISDILYVISSACLTPCSIDKTELQLWIDPYVLKITVTLELSVPSPWIKQFKLSQGVLYRCNEERGNRLLLVIPALYHREVISSCHSDSFVAHEGCE